MKSLDPLWRSILPSLILAAILALPQPLFAATLFVTNLGDTGAPGQLRTLINQAAPGDAIVIPAGTITLAGSAGDNSNQGGDLDISKNLFIQGAGAGVTIIDGGGIDRVFEIDPSGAAGIEVTISGLTIRNGKPPGADGGGIRHTSSGTLFLTNVTVSGNTAGDLGGGIFKGFGGPMLLLNSTVSGNTANRAGGIYINGGTITIANVTLSGNSAGANGGGIVNSGGDVALILVTVSGNSAGASGGGIANSSGAFVQLLNSTVSGNSAGASGGGIANSSGGEVILENTIVANSPSGGNCSGTITSLGHNLDSGTTCGFNQPGDLSNGNPLLGPLQDNGGFTQTHALLPGSPAIDAGDIQFCLPIDQRGFPGPRDGNGDGNAICDIGAFELGAVASVGNFGDTGAPGQLRTLINAAAPGDTVVIPAGTITLTAQAGGSLEIFQSLTLEGAGPGLTIIDGNGIGSVFEVNGSNVVISGVTVRNGNAGIQSTSREGITSNGSSTGRGGAYCIGCIAPVTNFSLSNTDLVGNSASEGGGGIAIAAGSGPVTLTNVTLRGNNTPLFGGGILNAGTMTLTNVTLSGNSANTSGGGIASAAGSTTLTNVTLSSNSAITSGGGIFNQGGTVQLQNTLIAGNTTGGQGPDCFGTLASQGFNLIQSTAGCSIGGVTTGNVTGVSPNLGPLSSNGGPTQTHALLPGSPAIDAVTSGCPPPSTDQRGVTRPQGPACDIGAYEAVAFDTAAASAFVTRLYEEVLGRAPDPVGLQGHLASIAQFGSVVTTVLAFFHSPEFLARSMTDGEFLTILYRTFLNRDPDLPGFTAFLGDLSGGCRTRDDLLGIFIRSQEFQALASFLPPLEPLPAFVTNLYILTLGRGPDQAGLQGFVAQLQQTRQVLPVVQGFLGSPEFLDRNTTNTEFVTVLFGVFLDRVPDCPGLAFFVARLDQGTATRAQIAAEFAASQEFQAIQRRLFP